MSRVTIVEDRVPKATIVVGKGASKGERFAAHELQIYVFRSTGAALTVRREGEAIAGSIIAVGRCQFNEQADLGLDRLVREGFRIKTTGHVLSIAGTDDTGTLFGVYAFLEEFLGIRWLWPGELGEVVPETRSIKIDQVDVTQEPDFKWRNRGPGGALWGATSGPTEMRARERLLGITRAHQLEVRLWEQRNQWGGMRIYGGHAMGEVYDPKKHGKTHPEYYALVDGKRAVPGDDYDYKHNGQVCTSNPKVIRIAVEWIRNFFDEHPDYDAVHLTMDDGSGFCECDECRALDSGEVYTRPGIDAEELKKDPTRFEKRVLTDRVYTYLNEVAREVQKTHPGKYVVSMAYSRYMMPPTKIRPHPFVIPQYCMWSAYRFSNDRLRDELQGIAAGWADKSERVGIYEYFVNGSWPGMHRLCPHLLGDSIKFLYEQGIDLYQTQSGDGFGVNGINYYVAGRLLWDTSLDVDAVLDDFFQKGFGGAAGPIKEFHHRLEAAWSRATADGNQVSCYSIEETSLLEYLTPGLLRQCRQDLDEAERLADSAEIRRRVEFCRQGLEYSELTVAAVWATKKVIDLGVDVLPKEGNLYPSERTKEQLQRVDSARARALVENAVRAWKARDDFVEQIKNEYVLPYFWVRYNSHTRTKFYPVENLRKLLKVLSAEET
jgi:hypothetical protein